MHTYYYMLPALILFSAVLSAAETAGTVKEFQAVELKAKLGAAKINYAAQSLGSLSQPLSDEINFAGITIGIKRLDKNVLEIDYGEKRPKKIKKTTILKVNAADPVKEGKKIKLYLEFKLDKQGNWTYASKTVLALMVPGLPGPLAIIDANSNGSFNDAHIDGVVWPNQRVAFPLPKSNERWVIPGLEITEFSLGTLGHNAKASVRALSSITPLGLDVLNGANNERVRLGLIPRPEDESLTQDLAKHCHWMAANKKLSHPEKAGTPGYSAEGHAAGMRSILSSGRGPELVGPGFVNTLYHRFDVIRAELKAFGVGSESNFSGIDGRSSLLSGAPQTWWPILCPMPEQTAVPLQFALEAPDPIKGDKSAGFPITVVFHTNKTKLNTYTLKMVDKGVLGPNIDCYTFDASDTFVKFGNAVALIPKDPLIPAAVYQVMIDAQVAGKAWTKTWVFQTR